LDRLDNEPTQEQVDASEKNNENREVLLTEVYKMRARYNGNTDETETDFYDDNVLESDNTARVDDDLEINNEQANKLMKQARDELGL